MLRMAVIENDYRNFYFRCSTTKKIDKTKKLCYYIYVIKRATGRPSRSCLPEETAVENKVCGWNGVWEARWLSPETNVRIVLPLLKASLKISVSISRPTD